MTEKWQKTKGEPQITNSEALRAFHIEKLKPNNPVDHEFVASRLFDFMYTYYKDFYPDFEKWYNEKVIPGFAEKKRSIHVVKDADSSYGVSIAKISQSSTKPNKISSFFLLPETKGYGLGTRLLEYTIDELKIHAVSHEVIITVPEERAGNNEADTSFLAFLKQNGFGIVDILNDKYRVGAKEYVLSAQLNRGKTQ